MQTEIKGAPSFAHMHILLNPGERIVVEAEAMSSMSSNLDMMTRFNGGFFSALAKRFLGDESLFVNEFINNTQEVCKLTVAQAKAHQFSINGRDAARKLVGACALTSQSALGATKPERFLVEWGNKEPVSVQHAMAD